MARGDATYAIEIAASMTGGEYTLAELDKLSAGLNGAGKDADHFERALKQVAGELSAAGAASSAAGAALAEGSAHYKDLERSANAAGKAHAKAQVEAAKAAAEVARLARGDAAGNVDERALARAERSARNAASNVEHMAKAAQDARAAVSAYNPTLQQLESAAEQASAAEKKLANTQKNLGTLQKHVGDRLGDSASKLSTFRGALGDVGGPLGEFGEKLLYPAQAFADLNEKFGSTAAAGVVAGVGIAAVAAAVIALTAVLVAGTLAAAAWAVGLADSARSAGLATEAFNAANPALAGLTGEFAKLEEQTGVSQDALRGIAKQLKAAKVSAADMPAALRAAALAESALGQGGASDFIARMQQGKKSVTALAAETESAFGGIVAEKMTGLDAQSARFKRNISGLFSGLNIDPVLAGLNTLVSMFDETTASGKAIKFLFETVFQPLIDQAQNAAWAIEAFSLGFIKGLLKVYIATKPAIKALGEMLGFEDTSLEDTLSGVADVGEIVAKGLVYLTAAFGAVVAVLAVLAASFALPIAALAAIPALAIASADAIRDAFTGAYNWLAGLLGTVKDALVSAWTSLGGDVVAGFIQGLLSKAGELLGSIRSLFSSVIGASREVLDSNSPSKAYYDMGLDTEEGYSNALRDATPDAQEAASAMVDPGSVAVDGLDALARTAAPSQMAAPQTATATASERSPKASLDMSGATFVFNNIKDAEQAEVRFGELLTRLLEGDVLALGGGEAFTNG